MGNAVAVESVESARRVADGRALNEQRLFRRYREHGDEVARERLVARFMPLAERLARRYAWGREPIEDLVQVAFVGLLKAVDRFDHERGLAFSTLCGADDRRRAQAASARHDLVAARLAEDA